MGVAEEDQGRLALQARVGDGLAILVGELERAADRGGCATLLTPPIAQNSTSRPTTRLAAKAVAITNGRAVELMSGKFPVAGQKQAAKPVLIISKNTWLP